MGTDRLENLKSLMESVVPIPSLDDEIDHAIAANSNSIVVDLATDVIVRAMTPAEVLFGYMPGELKGRSVHDLVPHRFRENHKMWVDQYRVAPMNRTMGSRGMALRGLRKDGYEFPVEISLAAVEVAGMELGIATIIAMVNRVAESGPLAVVAGV